MFVNVQKRRFQTSSLVKNFSLFIKLIIIFIPRHEIFYFEWIVIATTHLLRGHTFIFQSLMSNFISKLQFNNNNDPFSVCGPLLSSKNILKNVSPFSSHVFELFSLYMMNSCCMVANDFVPFQASASLPAKTGPSAYRCCSTVRTV